MKLFYLPLFSLTIGAFLGYGIHFTQSEKITITVPIYGYSSHPITGSIQLTSSTNRDGITINASIDGLTPGRHGFHIHEIANCNSPDGSSAKGHHNPHNQAHGAADSAIKHLGDLGNLEADGDGHAQLQIHLNNTHLLEAPQLGPRSFIIHQDPDDFTSQPAGNAGPRIACATLPSVMLESDHN